MSAGKNISIDQLMPNEISDSDLLNLYLLVPQKTVSKVKWKQKIKKVNQKFDGLSAFTLPNTLFLQIN